jgi:peptide/nickel transport system substrate-binding protein
VAEKLSTGSLSRRQFLLRTGAVAGGVAATRFAPNLAFAQATPASTPLPVMGGELIFGHFGDVDNYDPLTNALDLFQNYGRLLLFGSLTTYDVNLNLIGDLATSWELQDTSWVFKLREGVKWHDGSDFTADDVVYTFTHILDPNAGSFLTAQIGTDAVATAIDPLTASIKLNAINASYPDLLASVSIVKKDSADTNRAKPNGTGPFTFVSWSANQETDYAKNPNYYDPTRPYLDKLTFIPTPDPQVAVTNLEAGSVDVISNQLVLPQTAATLESTPGVKLSVVDPSTALAYANWIINKPPLNDKRVRQGMAMCLDLDGIKQLVYAGRGTPTNNIIPSLSWAYTDVGLYSYDPDKAKALFAEAGYPGFKTSILTIEGYPDLIAIAPIWQNGLKKAGVDASIETVEINDWVDRWAHSNYEVTLNFDINGPDPQRMFVGDLLLHIAQKEWSDQDLINTVQTQAAAAIATVDKDARKKIYADLQTYLFDQLPNLPIYRPAIIGATTDKVQGFAIDGKGYYHFDRTSLIS